jgi:hypothetical protein
MKASISLKQLRTDPREYVRLLNSGYEVSITEHRKTIATAKMPQKKQYSNVQAILDTIQESPPIRVLDPNLDTVTAIKEAKDDRLREKYGRP